MRCGLCWQTFAEPVALLEHEAREDDRLYDVGYAPSTGAEDQRTGDSAMKRLIAKLSTRRCGGCDDTAFHTHHLTLLGRFRFTPWPRRG